MTCCPICMNYDKTTLKMSVALSKVRMLVVVLMIVVHFYGLFHVCISYDSVRDNAIEWQEDSQVCLLEICLAMFIFTWFLILYVVVPRGWVQKEREKLRWQRIAAGSAGRRMSSTTVRPKTRFESIACNFQTNLSVTLRLIACVDFIRVFSPVVPTLRKSLSRSPLDSAAWSDDMSSCCRVPDAPPTAAQGIVYFDIVLFWYHFVISFWQSHSHLFMYYILLSLFLWIYIIKLCFVLFEFHILLYLKLYCVFISVLLCRLCGMLLLVLRVSLQTPPHYVPPKHTVMHLPGVLFDFVNVFIAYFCLFIT